MLKRALRLHTGFKRILEHGKRIKTDLFILYLTPNTNPHSRFGLIVTKKLGTAVVRNTIKRRFRASFLNHTYELPTQFDIIIIPSKFVANWKEISFKQIDQSIHSAFKKI